MKHKPLVPNRLSKYRKMMGYSQRDVARLLGVKSASRISKWEKGTHFPGIKNLIKLSVLYRTLIDQLYYDLRAAICADVDSRRPKTIDVTGNITNKPP